MRIEIIRLQDNNEDKRLFKSSNVEGLKSSIQDYGVKQPIAIDRNNVIVDGHRRVKACRQLGIESIECQVVENTIENVLLLNQHRRKSYSELLHEGLEWEKIFSVSAKENQRRGGQGYPSEGQPFHTNVEVAKRLGIGKDTYFRLKKINENQPDLLEQIDEAELSVKEAYSRVAPPEDTKTISSPTTGDNSQKSSEPQSGEEDDSAKDEGEEEEETDKEDDDNTTPFGPTRRGSEEGEKENNKGVNVSSNGTLPRLVLADPPWRYGSTSSGHGSPDDHYETLTTEEIIAHKPEIAQNCILLLWATSPKLEEALYIMEQWGFEYKTHAIWDKGDSGRPGLGYWFRGIHELLLVGVKGRTNSQIAGEIHIPASEHRRSSIFREPKREHSQKPECVYQWIEEAFPELTKLEMYARTPREGWMQWGNDPAIVEKNSQESNTEISTEEDVEVGSSSEGTAEDEFSTA